MFSNLKLETAVELPWREEMLQTQIQSYLMPRQKTLSNRHQFAKCKQFIIEQSNEILSNKYLEGTLGRVRK